MRSNTYLLILVELRLINALVFCGLLLCFAFQGQAIIDLSTNNLYIVLLFYNGITASSNSIINKEDIDMTCNLMLM